MKIELRTEVFVELRCNDRIMVRPKSDVDLFDVYQLQGGYGGIYGIPEKILSGVGKDKAVAAVAESI